MKVNKILVAILLLGGLLRLVGISYSPAGFTPDEASFGYDAYSIIHTGRDQWGHFLPLVLKSFGDGKMPLYSYLAIPSVYVFGLTEFAVRLPNALFGTLAIFAVFLLTKEIKDKRTAYVAAFLLSVSPWHIPLSRGAFEANLTTFFLPLSLYFFYKGQKSGVLLYASALFAGLNLFTYHSARITTPVVLLSAVWFSRTKLSHPKRYALPAVVFGVFVLLSAYTYLFGAGGRLASSSVLNSAKVSGEISYFSAQLGVPYDLSRVLHNKVFYSGSLFIKNYLEYFSPQFLFTDGPAEGTYGMVPGIGTLYLVEVVFIVSMIVGAIRRDIKLNKTILFWIIIAPIPAALSAGPGRAANRAAVVMPALQILAAFGAVYLYRQYRHFASRKLVKIAMAFVVIVSVIGFVENFTVQQRFYNSKSMIYGTKEVFSYIKRNEGLYRQIIITKNISEPHMYAAFYLQIPPEDYQLESKHWDFESQGLGWVDQLPTYSLGKYTFKNIDWVADPQNPGVLIVASPGDFPENTPVVHTIYYPDGKVAYLMIDPISSDFVYHYEDR